MTALPDFQMLTAADIATHLRISKMTVYRLIEDGELRAYRVGRSLRVTPGDFTAYMRRADLEGEISSDGTA